MLWTTAPLTVQVDNPSQASKRHIAAFVIFFATCAVILAAYSYLIYDFSVEGTILLVGSTALLTLATSMPIRMLRHLLPVSKTLPLAMLGATLSVAAFNFDSARIGFELRQAREILSSISDQSHLTSEVEKYPYNRVLRALNAAWSNTNANHREISRLLKDAESTAHKIDQPVYKFPIPEMRQLGQGYRQASQKLSQIAVEIPSLYANDLTATSGIINELNIGKFGSAMISGMKDRNSIEVEYLLRYVGAYEALFRNVADQADFFLAGSASYDPSTNKIKITDRSALQRFKQMISAMQQSIKHAQAIEDQRTMLQKQEKRRFDMFKNLLK